MELLLYFFEEARGAGRPCAGPRGGGRPLEGAGRRGDCERESDGSKASFLLGLVDRWDVTS